MTDDDFRKLIPALPHPDELECRKAPWQQCFLGTRPQLIELDCDLQKYALATARAVWAAAIERAEAKIDALDDEALQQYKRDRVPYRDGFFDGTTAALAAIRELGK